MSRANIERGFAATKRKGRVNQTVTKQAARLGRKRCSEFRSIVFFLCGFFPLFGCFKWFVVLKSVCVLREAEGTSGRDGFGLGAANFFVEDDGFGNFAHGHAALAALLLEHQVGFFFA